MQPYSPPIALNATHNNMLIIVNRQKQDDLRVHKLLEIINTCSSTRRWAASSRYSLVIGILAVARCPVFSK